MIIKRKWHRSRICSRKYYEGWFLLGIIPLYISCSDWV